MLLLVLLFAIMIIFIIISLMKKLLKIAFILAVIFVILFLVTGGTIMGDFSRIKQSIPTASKIVLLENDGNIITGFIDDDGIVLITNDEVNLLSILYGDKDLEQIKGEYSKLYIIKSSKLGDIEINNKQVTLSQLNDFFLNGLEISSITFEDIALGIDLKNDQYRYMESAAFAYIYENDLRMTKSPLSFFKGYKEGKIIVHPETIFFKFTKVIPLSWIDEKLNKLKV